MKKWGYILIAASVVPFLLMLAVPFLGLPGNWKAGVLVGLAIVAEGLFWIGGLLLGKELFAKYKARMNPLNWFRSKPEQEKARASGEES